MREQAVILLSNSGQFQAPVKRGAPPRVPVVEVETTAKAQANEPVRGARRWWWGAVLGVVMLWSGGGFGLRALTSGSAMVLSSGGAAEAPMALQAGTYCPALPAGLEQMKGAGLLPDAPRFYWLVRQFGGRWMDAGERVEVLERAPAMVQVRDPETSAICYLPSHLLPQR